MSRIRSVHPGFFKDERLVECSAFARLLFIGLGVEADDKGIFEWKPITIKMNVFPGDNIDVPSLLAELSARDQIRMYEIDGRKYGAIRNFRKFQRPKTPNDIHPMTEEIAAYVGIVSEKAADDEGSFPRKGEKPPQMEDGGGKMEEDQKASPSLRAERWEKGRRVPDDWKMWAMLSFPSVEPAKLSAEFRQFEEYWPTKPGKAGARTDWEAQFHMWMRNKFGASEVDQNAPQSPGLVVLSENDPDFALVARARGKRPVVGQRGTTTVSLAEVEAARRELAH